MIRYQVNQVCKTKFPYNAFIDANECGKNYINIYETTVNEEKPNVLIKEMIASLHSSS